MYVVCENTVVRWMIDVCSKTVICGLRPMFVGLGLARRAECGWRGTVGGLSRCDSDFEDSIFRSHQFTTFSNPTLFQGITRYGASHLLEPHWKPKIVFVCIMRGDSCEVTQIECYFLGYSRR